tara:strand:- start:2560 stop:3063 length:504 start_codon:yes stop_codon:yes gene_type:complete
MEKRLVCKINDYQDKFKLDIKTWVEKNDSINFDSKSELLKFIYDYDALTLNKEDFTKRKRVKSFVPHYLRCNAKRANGEQCTRKKKDDSCYCGTHDKNRPHGIIDCSECKTEQLTKMQVWPQEINGILYYIDNNNNIYKSEEIIQNKINPVVIAKYKLENGVYSILD